MITTATYSTRASCFETDVLESYLEESFMWTLQPGALWDKLKRFQVGLVQTSGLD